MKQEKDEDQQQQRMRQDVKETSRTMKPGPSVKGSGTSSQNSGTSPTASGGITNIRTGKDAEENSARKH